LGGLVQSVYLHKVGGHEEERHLLHSRRTVNVVVVDEILRSSGSIRISVDLLLQFESSHPFVRSSEVEEDEGSRAGVEGDSEKPTTSFHGAHFSTEEQVVPEFP